jgi:hypothetical protein
MEHYLWVRELSVHHPLLPLHAHTGDVLADGSVLLREPDIDHMGLEGLRNWLRRLVLEQHATIVLAREYAHHH